MEFINVAKDGEVCMGEGKIGYVKGDRSSTNIRRIALNIPDYRLIV
ncbi:MAG: hypothetical protein AAFR58_14640 [Cyanobacteria bacterium J06627_28]